MNRLSPLVLIFTILTLFLIQSAGSLVESIYILNLLNTSLNAYALGLLFFFSPGLLFLLRRQTGSIRPAWAAGVLLVLARGLLPFLDTPARLLAAGLSTGATLLLLPMLLTAREKKNNRCQPGFCLSVGAALATAGSVLLRTVYTGLDYSLFPTGGWLGWLLGGLLLFLLSRLDWARPITSPARARVFLPSLGVLLALTLLLFAFSAPAVIVRWTQGSYPAIVGAVSLLSLAAAVVIFARPGWLQRISRGLLLGWNVLFTLAIIGVILANQVMFPTAPDAAPAIVGSSTLLQQALLALMLLLSPVVFVNIHVFAVRIQRAAPAPRDLAPAFLVGGLALILLIFFQIFTNTWGYVPPVSPWFRGKFWLSYLLISVLLALLAGRLNAGATSTRSDQVGSPRAAWWVWAPPALLFAATVLTAWITTQPRRFEAPDKALRVMTYNIQQANDDVGERSFLRQLALIRQVDPDILALQECDSTRISLNNNDYVLFFASQLGYHVYYGPRTVTGTFGTAILSKYPLENTHTVFTYSDQDEVGTAVASVTLDGRTFRVYNVHPDGSDAAMLAFAETLLQQSAQQENVIALGDFNLRDTEEAYRRIQAVYTNAWESVYPTLIGGGVDMSGRNRIDHIFISRHLQAQDPVYVLPPASATDHPVHWADIAWTAQ